MHFSRDHRAIDSIFEQIEKAENPIIFGVEIAPLVGGETIARALYP